MASATMSIRLDTQTKKRLEKLAKIIHRTKSFLANEAINTYLQTQEWQISEINQGFLEADNNDLLDHKAVLDRWEQRKRANSMDNRG